MVLFLFIYLFFQKKCYPLVRKKYKRCHMYKGHASYRALWLRLTLKTFHSISKWRLPVLWMLSLFCLEYLHMTHDGRQWGDPKVPWLPMLTGWASLGRSCGRGASISAMLLNLQVWSPLTSTQLTLFVTTRMENQSS